MFVIRSIHCGFLGDGKWVKNLTDALKFLPGEKERALQMAWRAQEPTAEFVTLSVAEANSEPFVADMNYEECLWINRG